VRRRRGVLEAVVSVCAMVDDSRRCFIPTSRNFGETWGIPFTTKRLEIKLQRELDQAWIAGCLKLSELRSADFDRHGFDLSGGANRPPQRVHVIPDVEEVGTELEVHLLTDRERLED